MERPFGLVCLLIHSALSTSYPHTSPDSSCLDAGTFLCMYMYVCSWTNSHSNEKMYFQQDESSFLFTGDCSGGGGGGSDLRTWRDSLLLNEQAALSFFIVYLFICLVGVVSEPVLTPALLCVAPLWLSGIVLDPLCIPPTHVRFQCDFDWLWCRFRTPGWRLVVFLSLRHFSLTNFTASLLASAAQEIRRHARSGSDRITGVCEVFRGPTGWRQNGTVREAVWVRKRRSFRETSSSIPGDSHQQRADASPEGDEVCVWLGVCVYVCVS